MQARGKEEIGRRNLLKFNGNGFVLFARQYHTHTARVFPDECVYLIKYSIDEGGIFCAALSNGWLLYPPR